MPEHHNIVESAGTFATKPLQDGLLGGRQMLLQLGQPALKAH